MSNTRQVIKIRSEVITMLSADHLLDYYITVFHCNRWEHWQNCSILA